MACPVDGKDKGKGKGKNTSKNKIKSIFVCVSFGCVSCVCLFCVCVFLCVCVCFCVFLCIFVCVFLCVLAAVAEPEQVEPLGTPAWCADVPAQYRSAACRGSLCVFCVLSFLCV